MEGERFLTSRKDSFSSFLRLFTFLNETFKLILRLWFGESFEYLWLFLWKARCRGVKRSSRIFFNFPRKLFWESWFYQLTLCICNVFCQFLYATQVFYTLDVQKVSELNVRKIETLCNIFLQMLNIVITPLELYGSIY